MNQPKSACTTKQIVAANDIAEVIGSYFPLRRAGANLAALCPFHNEKTPSFTVSRSRQRFHCFGCGAHGDVLEFVMRYERLDFQAAYIKLAERAGNIRHLAEDEVPAASWPKFSHLKAGRCQDLSPIPLDFLERGTHDDFRRLAASRNVAPEAIEIASAAGLLRFATLTNCRAWVITDVNRYVAEARRLDGNPWQHIGAKAWTLRGSSKRWPVGIVEAQDYRAILLVEGGPDFLAAYHFMWTDARTDVAPVAMLGASLSIHPIGLPLFANKRVRILPHYDPDALTGFDAARRWAAQLRTVGAAVDCFNCAGLVRSDGAAVFDANDLCSVCYDDWQNEAGQLLP